MEHAIYKSGENYLIAELRGGNPVRGLLVGRDGGKLLDDIKSFDTNEVRIGCMRLNLMATAGLASRSVFLAKERDGMIVEQMVDASFDPSWIAYAELS